MEKQAVDVPALIAWLKARQAELQAEFGVIDAVGSFEMIEVDMLTLIKTAKQYQPADAHATGGKSVYLWYIHEGKHVLTLTADME